MSPNVTSLQARFDGSAHASPRYVSRQQPSLFRPDLVIQRFRHLAPLTRIALLVAMGDYVTKEAAARFVAHEPTVFNSWLRFAVVHNEAAAFGVSLGTYTWQLNLALTLAAIVFVIPVSQELGRVDKAAPRALGLIAGGALGNLASLILSPRGVVDFIAVHVGEAGVVLNVADVAAYVGLAMITRTGFLIVAELRRTLRPELRPVVQQRLAPRLSLALVDREVSRPIFRDDTGSDSAIGDVGSSTPSTARVLELPVGRERSHPMRPPIIADAPRE